MMTRKELKDSIGERIAFIPQGNAVKRGTPLKEQVIEAVLTKVGSRYMTLGGKSYPIDGGYNAHNYGYEPYKTRQEALDRVEARILTQRLKSTEVDWRHLSLTEVLSIQGIIEKGQEDG